MHEIARADVRSAIIASFERHRAVPGAPYDEARFLDFLLAEPKGDRAVYDSFEGARRFGRFLEDVQYELGVCFSIKDRDAHYPLDAFIARVEALQRSRRGSLKSLRNQMNDVEGWGVLILANALFLGMKGFIGDSFWATAALGTVAAAVNLAVAAAIWRGRSYRRRLLGRLLSLAGQTSEGGSAAA